MDYLIFQIGINHSQYAIAVKEKMEDMCELLNIMERIIIEARIYKEDNNIPDAPDEIELAIADIEIVAAKAEQRQDALTEFTQPAQPSRSKVQQQQDNDSQLSLF